MYNTIFFLLSSIYLFFRFNTSVLPLILFKVFGHFNTSKDKHDRLSLTLTVHIRAIPEITVLEVGRHFFVMSINHTIAFYFVYIPTQFKLCDLPKPIQKIKVPSNPTLLFFLE